ncbi:MAG TPA: RES domain-containing protein [Sphingobacteriaceae bacterium]
MPTNASKFLCYECVGDTYLSREIRDGGAVEICTYCEQERSSIPLEQAAERFHEVFCKLYKEEEGTPTFTGDDDRTDFKYYGSTPRQLIGEVMEVDDPISEDIYNFLHNAYNYRAIRDGSPHCYDNTPFVEIDISSSGYSLVWEKFCSRIKHKYRFFDIAAQDDLGKILNEVLNYRSLSGKAAVRMIDPHDEARFIYRARQADNDEAIMRICQSPDKELGPPPQHVVTAGRMNPVGISVFYGAFDDETCIAEIRLPVGGRAVVGKFEIIRPLRILDFTVFDDYPEAISKFDPDYINKRKHFAFLETFHQEIRKPVLPRDEVLDYIPTQAVAEYLATLFNPALDGLIFSSAQNDGQGHNIVIFNHAAKVEVMGPLVETIRPEAKFKPYFDEDSMAFVIEEIRDTEQENSADSTTTTKHHPYVLYWEDLFEEPEIEPALRFVPHSISIFKVTSVRHDTEIFSVHQYTVEDRNDFPF